jgi:hypothetical protein
MRTVYALDAGRKAVIDPVVHGGINAQAQILLRGLPSTSKVVHVQPSSNSCNKAAQYRSVASRFLRL